MKRKWKLGMGFFIVLILLFTSYGYAALNTELQLSGEAYVRVEADIRITDLSLTSISIGGYEPYHSKYSKFDTSMFVWLPSRSYAIYEVEITNKSDDDYFIKSINGDFTDVHLEDTKVYDVIAKHSVRRVHIKLANSSATSKEIYRSLEFVFQKDQLPTITLGNLPVWLTKGDEYPISLVYNAGPSGGTAKCTSNLDSSLTNITDLKDITTPGTHNITCTVTSNSGKKATATKSTKITYDPYPATNIIPNGSFESAISGLTAVRGTVSQSTSYVSHGSRSLKLSAPSSAAEAYVLFPAFNYIKGHKYYYQLYYYIPTNISFLPSIDLYCLASNRTTDSGLPRDEFLVKGGAIASLYVNKPDWANNNTMQFRFDSNNVNQNLDVYFDAAIAVDLTATFGSGSEPDKAWCDKHIRYFNGTGTIYK